jgi:hypothetical protein
LAFYLLLPLLSNITKLIKGCKTSNVLRHSVMYTFMYCIIISRIYLSVRRNCDYSIHRVLFWVSIWLVVYPVTVPKAQPTAIQHVPRYALKGGESGYNTESLTIVGNMYGSMNVKVNVCRLRIKDWHDRSNLTRASCQFLFYSRS